MLLRLVASGETLSRALSSTYVRDSIPYSSVATLRRYARFSQRPVLIIQRLRFESRLLGWLAETAKVDLRMRPLLDLRAYTKMIYIYAVFIIFRCGPVGQVLSLHSPGRLVRADGKARGDGDATYLVDPASSHMLVSKIKPCMSKYKLLHGETANGSLNQLWFIRWCYPTWITVVILELIHATKLRPSLERALLLDQDQPVLPSGVPSD